MLKAYAVQLVENEVSVHIENLCDRLAAVLNLEVGTPAITAYSTVKDKFGTIIAFGASVYAPNSGEIRFHLHSNAA